MSGSAYAIGVFVDDNPWDVSWLDAESRRAVERGDVVSYGVGLLREDNGRLTPDYGTFVWSCFADAGLDGTYLTPDAIPNEYLADTARDQVEEHG